MITSACLGQRCAHSATSRCSLIGFVHSVVPTKAKP